MIYIRSSPKMTSTHTNLLIHSNPVLIRHRLRPHQKTAQLRTPNRRARRRFPPRRHRGHARQQLRRTGRLILPPTALRNLPQSAALDQGARRRVGHRTLFCDPGRTQGPRIRALAMVRFFLPPPPPLFFLWLSVEILILMFFLFVCFFKGRAKL